MHSLYRGFTEYLLQHRATLFVKAGQIYCPSHVPVQTNFRRYFCYILLNQAQTRLDQSKVLDELWSKISIGFDNR